MNIRPAVSGDLDRIYEIVCLAFGPYCAAKLLEDRFGLIDGKPWTEHKAGSVVESCRRRLDRVVVAEEDGRVAGFATFALRGEEGEVGNNAVDPAFQGRGIGTRLIHHVLRRMAAQGATRFKVTTMEHDRPARRVYEKMGFREVRRSVLLAKRAETGVESERVDAADEAALARLKEAGFEELARSVHYEMTRPDFEAAAARLGLD